MTENPPEVLVTWNGSKILYTFAAIDIKVINVSIVGREGVRSPFFEWNNDIGDFFFWIQIIRKKVTPKNSSAIEPPQ